MGYSHTPFIFVKMGGERILSDYRTYNEKRQIFNYNTLVSGEGETALVCINRDVLPILVELLATRGNWRTSYFVSQSAQGYTLPTEGQFHNVSNLIGNAINELQRGYDMANCDALIAAINGLGTQLAQIESGLSVQANIQLTGSCGCAAQGTNPNPTDNVVACEVPEGFDTMDDFTAYACKAINWLYDKTLIALQQVSQSYFWLHSDYSQESGASRLSVNQVYQRMAQNQASVFALEWLYNMGDISKATVTSALTDLYVQFQTDKFVRVPEIDDLDDVIFDWYTGASNMVVDLIANRATNIQTLYDATTPTALKTEFDTIMDTARAYAFGIGNGLDGLDIIHDMSKAMFDVGVGSLAFARSVTINAYESTTACTGAKGCCPAITVLFGIADGGGMYTATLEGSVYEVDIIFNAIAPLDTCGEQSQVNGNDATTGTIDRWRIYDDLDVVQYDNTVKWTGGSCSRRFRYSSSVPFTVDATGNACS